MPIITCPKCQGKLKFPEDSPARRVKCPTCGNVFMSSDGLHPNNPEATPPSSDAKRGSKGDVDLERRRSEDDDRNRRRRDDDDDDDRDRRGRRRDDDDDDDDRDRGRRRRDDDDDDDDGDRRRRRARRDERRRRRPKQDTDGQYNRASLSCLLTFISGWLQVGGLGILALVAFLTWCGVTDGMKFFTLIAGLLGIGCWLTSSVGFGIGVSGPRERGALGFSIALACVAGLHLLFTIIVAISRQYDIFGMAGGGSTVQVNWARFVTSNTSLSYFMFILINVPFTFIERVIDSYLLGIFANFAEVARTLMLLFWLRAVMRTVKENRAADSCMKTIIIYSIGAGVVVVLGLFFGAIGAALAPSKGAQGDFRLASTMYHIYNIVQPLVLIGMGILVNLVVKTMKGNIDYRR